MQKIYATIRGAQFHYYSANICKTKKFFEPLKTEIKIINQIKT